MATANVYIPYIPYSYVKKLHVDQSYFCFIIGKAGNRIKEIRSIFNNKVEINLHSTSDIIEIRSNDSFYLDKCEKLLNLLVEEIKENNCLTHLSVVNQLEKFEKDKKKPICLYQVSGEIPVEQIG